MGRFAFIVGLMLVFVTCITSHVFAATPAPQAPNTSSICNSVSNSTEQAQCNSCMADNTKVWTAIGCIHTGDDPAQFLTVVLNLGIGIAGGIAFLLILFGGLQIMTSAGNPEQLNAGRELVTSAITGLLLIIFSIFLLQFIGINIIGIPGFVSSSQSSSARGN